MSGQDLDALLGDFLAEAEERAARVEQLLLDLPGTPAADRAALLERARRELHTLKGNAGMMGFADLQMAVHGMEDATERLDPRQPRVQPLLEGLDRLRERLAELHPHRRASDVAVGTGEGVRLPYRRLDALVEQLAAQLLARHRMAEALSRGLAGDGHGDQAPAWASCEQTWLELDRLLEGLQADILELRMVPVSALFGRLRRVVHNESDKSGKQVRFEARGGDTPVDRALIDAASEILGHLVRNAVVHGVETPERRRRTGKPERGMVRLEAAVRSDSVQIDVLDDGAGIDREALRRAAEEAGVRVEDDDLQALMFHAGLSTRSEADLSAGRGVGMNVVLEAVRRAGGSIEVASRAGIGTRFRLRLPISVSIAKAMLLEADGRTYALPVAAILETLALPAASRGRALTWRGRELPLLDLGRFFGSRGDRRQHGFVVAVEGGGRLCGLVVDATRGPLEIMVRGLDDLLQDLPGVAGSTVLGDGRVVLILDSQGLAARRHADEEAA